MHNLSSKEKHSLLSATTLIIALWILRLCTAAISSRVNLSITLLAILGFSSYFLFKKIRTKNKFEDKHHPLQKSTTALANQVKSSSIARLTKLIKRDKAKPWVLLLGPQGAGKTSLLANSGIKFSSPTNKTLTHVSPTNSIDWWLSDSATFIDPAAKYCFCTHKETEENEYWQRFLQQTTKEQPNSLASACLVIDLPSLVCHNDTAFENLLNRFKQQILTLANLQQPLCVNLIITQTDQITGFAEFFSDLTEEEQKESFGVSLFDPSHSTHKTDLFRDRFNDFIHTLNLRTCKRLHHERNLERRKRMVEFPLQLETLAQAIIKLLESIPDSPQIVMNHVFFCSAQQSIHTHNLFSQELYQAFQIKQTPHSPLIATQQSLFIHNALIKTTKSLAPTPIEEKQTIDKWWHFASYPAALALVFAVTGVLHHVYQKDVSLIKTTEISLKDQQKTTWLKQLNLLASIKKKLDASHSTESSLLGLTQTANIKNQVNQAYQAQIQGQFFHFLNQSLSDEIKIETKNNSTHLYKPLQVYLMFSHPEKMDTKLVSKWFQATWKKALPNDKKTQQMLSQYLQIVLHTKQLHWKQDQTLVKNAQKALNQEPPEQTAFKMLLQQNSQANVPITKLNNITGVNLKNATIPSLYRLDKFKDVYQKQIPALAKSVLQGNWVIGRPSSKENEAQAIAKLRQIYLTHYLSHWQKALSQITFTTPNSLLDASNQINLITNNQSPLWQLYEQVITTAKSAGAKADSSGLSSYEPNSPEAKPMLAALSKLQAYLKEINNAPSSAKAAYDKTVTRFKTNGDNDPITQVLNAANNEPQPVKQWVHAIAENSWTLMLKQSRLYLNALWTTTVVPAYSNTIENRFPIYSTKSEDISTNDFNAFFGPGGLIQNFFNDNLTPFANMSSTYWTWKKLDGQSIGISQATMDMLMRASMIQRMFYSHGADAPNTHFQLTPISLSKNASQFILNVGGQMMHQTPTDKQHGVFNWPGASGNFVTMRFTDTSKKNNPTLTTMGPWAWLHLLTHATVTKSTDSRDFQVNFTLKGLNASYQLTADSPANPYSPGLMTGFRCPQSL